MADIYNEESNTLLSGTRDDDSIDNYGDEVSINAGNGDDYIYNSGDSVTIEAGAGNDSIDNDGENVSIDGGAGNDYIYNYVGTSNADIAFDSAYEGAVVTLSGGAGDDTINNDGGSSLVSIDAGAGNDSIDNGGDKVSIDAGAGNDSIENNCGAEVSINAGAGNDSVLNGGDSVTIAAGAGNDDIYSYGDNVSINGGADDDYIHNYWGDSVTINAGAGDDSIELGSYWGGNTLKGGEGADVFFYYEGDLEEYYDYEPEDDEISNDILADYEEADTIYFPYYTTINKISTNSSGSVIFTVGEYNHKLVVKNAADKVVTYIDSDGTTKTFGGSTDSKLITLTEGNDTYSNTLDGATINALGGNDSIENYGSNVSIDLGAGDDSIRNHGSNVSINAGAGNDTIINGAIDGSGSNVSINAGAGNDTIINGAIDGSGSNVSINAGAGNDTIINYSESDSVSIDAGAGNDYISNSGSLVSITGGTGDDSIKNWGNRLTIDAGDGNDEIYNNDGDNLSILGGAGSDYIYNYSGDNVTIDAGEGNDTLYGGGDSVTIDGGAGDDSISNHGSNVSINGGAGDDTLWGNASNDTLTGGAGSDLFIFYYDTDEYYGTDTITDYEEADTIQFQNVAVSKISTNSSGSVIFKVGKNKLVVKNAADKIITYIDADGTTKTFGGSSADEWQLDGTTATYGSLTVKGVKSLDGLSLSGKVVTVSASSLGTSKVTVSDGYTLKLGSDVSSASTKKAWSLSKTTATYKQTTTAGYSLADNAITYTEKSSKTLATVKGVKSLDGLKLSGKVVTVSASSLGTSKVTVSDGYTLKLGSDVSSASTKKAWSLSKTTATYKQTTTAGYSLAGNEIIYSKKSSKTLATVKGVKSLDGLSVSRKVVTVSAASLGTSKVTISDGYTLALGSDVSSASTKKSWSLSKTTATYKQTTTAGYTLEGNEIIYSKKSSKTLATVKGVKSLDGLSLSGKVVTISAASLGTSKVTISDGYTLALGSDVSSASTKKAWSLSKTTATYKQTTTAGYSLDDNAITYTEKDSATLATVKGATSKSGLKVSGKTIKLSTSALSKKVTVSGAYTFDFADDYSKATITGSSSADTIVARGKKISVKGGAGNDTLKILGTGTVTGGAGADVFALKSTAANVISDYAAEDKISLTSGTADFSVKGDDLLLNDKVTLTGAAALKVTYIEGGVEKIYTKPAEDTEAVKLNGAGTGVTLTVHYNDDTFDAADYAGSLVTIKASDVLHTLTITGNKNANKIVGTGEEDYIDGLAGSDTISGGKGDDTLIGGAGSDSLNGGAGEDSLLGGDKGDILLGGAGNDTLWGNKGDDTLMGGDGDDIFIYEDGDGKDIISDYLSVDKVIVLSGKVESPSVDVDGNVIFKVGSGQITFPNSANKYIELLDEYGNIRGGGVYKPPTTK